MSGDEETMLIIALIAASELSNVIQSIAALLGLG